MGTIEGKLRESYTVKQKPIIRSPCQRGIEPVLHWPGSHKNLHESLEPEKASQHKIVRKFTIDNSDDEKPEVDNVREYPFCTVGLVSYEVARQTRYGTGFLIYKNVVLTSAHNLYCLEKEQEAVNICFIPTPLGRKQKQILNASRTYIPEEFKASHSETSSSSSKHSNKLFDYGVIVLQENVNLQDNNGFLGVNFNAQEHGRSRPKTIIGYSNSESLSTKLYRCEIKASFDQGLLNYQLPVDINLPGGPIVEDTDGGYFVTGIHISEKAGEGIGIQLNSLILAQLNKWLKIEEEQIDLRDNNLGKAGIKQLVKYKNAFHLINLSRNNIGKEGLKHFPRVDWPNLYHLDLGGNNLEKEGLEFLVMARIPNLKMLNLWGNQIKRQGVEVLVMGKWLSLQTLNLYNNSICNQGLQVLVRKRWHSLTSLNVGKNRLNNSSVQLIVGSSWDNLVCLNLWGNNLKQSKQIDKSMSQRFPKLKFLYIE